MHPIVHSSTIYNSQYVEATKMSISREMDKENVVYTHTHTHTHTHKIEFYSVIKKNKIMPLAAT